MELKANREEGFMVLYTQGIFTRRPSLKQLWPLQAYLYTTGVGILGMSQIVAKISVSELGNKLTDALISVQ